MKSTYTVYIDEAGDLGASKGTQWFVLTGVLIKKEKEKEIRDILSRVRAKVNLSYIHWRSINSFPKRSYIANQLLAAPFTYCNVLIDTSMIDGTQLTPTLLYNYACRFLLERASWFLRDMGATADIVLSSRGTSRDDELKDYIETKLFSSPESTIENRFGEVYAKDARKWDMLQVADICASSLFSAMEKDGFGFTYPCRYLSLSKRLYHYAGEYQNYGIMYYDEEMQPRSDAIMQSAVCCK